MYKSLEFILIVLIFINLSSCSKTDGKLNEDIVTWGEHWVMNTDTMLFLCKENNDIDTILTDKVRLLQANSDYHASQDKNNINTKALSGKLEVNSRILHNGVTHKLSIIVNAQSDKPDCHISIDNNELKKVNNDDMFFGEYVIATNDSNRAGHPSIQNIIVTPVNVSKPTPLQSFVIDGQLYERSIKFNVPKGAQ